MRDETVIDRETWEALKSVVIFIMFIFAVFGALGANTSGHRSGYKKGQTVLCETICDSDKVSVKEDRCYCMSKEGVKNE